MNMFSDLLGRDEEKGVADGERKEGLTEDHPQNYVQSTRH